MPRARLQALNQYRELALVVVAAVIGLTVQSPLVRVVHHQGVDIFLVILVFATAITIEPGSLRQLPTLWRRLTVALLVGVSVLPALSWTLAHLIAPGSLRQGITTMGLAPCEIASIATTAMAGGDAAMAGGILVGSTILTVSVAGLILALEAPGASIHPGHIIVNLLIVVALPLAAGLAARALLRLPAVTETIASTTSVFAVAVLVALIAAEVHFSLHYLPVLAAILLFVLASAILGRLLALGARPSVMKAFLLTTSMRDFAIAAGVASAAFGAPAAAPLGLYGIIVLIWGTGAAGLLRKRSSVAT
jgi:predicted Na+-dependent transporter